MESVKWILRDKFYRKKSSSKYIESLYIKRNGAQIIYEPYLASIWIMILSLFLLSCKFGSCVFSIKFFCANGTYAFIDVHTCAWQRSQVKGRWKAHFVFKGRYISSKWDINFLSRFVDHLFDGSRSVADGRAWRVPGAAYT